MISSRLWRLLFKQIDAKKNAKQKCLVRSCNTTEQNVLQFAGHGEPGQLAKRPFLGGSATFLDRFFLERETSWTRKTSSGRVTKELLIILHSYIAIGLPPFRSVVALNPKPKNDSSQPKRAEHLQIRRQSFCELFSKSSAQLN
jgi:hypothetical protein